MIGSDGSFAHDTQPLSRMNVMCIAKDAKGQSSRGSSGGGGRVGLDYFGNEKSPGLFCEEAARQAIIQLDARPRPPAKWKSYSVLDGPAFCCTKPSVMAWKPTSTAKARRHFTGLDGRRVASDKCTVIDNGTCHRGADH